MFSKLSVIASGVVWCGVMHSNYDRGGKFTGGSTPDPMSEYLEYRWDGGFVPDREKRGGTGTGHPR